MLKIRLQRTGRKNVPTFRIVLTDSKNSTKSGKFIEVLGNHDPRGDKGEVKADKVKYWMSQGAQLTGTLHNLFIKKGIIKGGKVNKLPKNVPQKKEEVVVSAPKKEVATAPIKEEVSVVDEVATEVAPAVAEVTEEAVSVTEA
jgi:small subunit ribosomal protein S16